MSTRNATTADAVAITALLNRVIADRDGTTLPQPLTVAEEAEYISGLLSNGGCLLLAEQEGVLMGFQSVQRQTPELGEIGTFVVRAARGLGVGRRLLQATRRWAEAQGVRVLLAEVAASNEAGQRAYRAWGFLDAPEQAEVLEESGKIRLILNLSTARSPASSPAARP